MSAKRRNESLRKRSRKRIAMAVIIFLTALVFCAISSVNESRSTQTDLQDGFYFVEVTEIIAAGKVRVSGDYFISGEKIAEMNLEIGDRLEILVMDMEVRRIELR